MSALKKSRILYVNHTGLVSGAEKVLLSILQGLDRRRYEPLVVCPRQGGLAEEISALNVDWLPIPAVDTRFASRPSRIFRSIAPLLKTIRAIRRRIRVLNPEIVHANSVRAGLVTTLAAAGLGKPVIWHVHDTLPNRALGTAIRVFALLAGNTRVVAVSQSTANAFCGRLPLQKKVHTIYNGVDLSKFPPKQPGRSVFREKLGVPREAFLVCAIGQVCVRKGLLELIGAVRRIEAQAPQMHLAIVGRVVFRHEEDYLRALMAEARHSGMEERIHFVGELRDVSPALQAANLLVLNSQDEPFGLVLVEAMSTGTPVVATRVGGIPEIVTDGQNGWLVEAGDTQALAEKLLNLSRSRNALAQAAERARQETCPRFSLERFHSELMKFYSEFDPNFRPAWSVRHRPALAKSGNN